MSVIEEAGSLFIDIEHLLNQTTQSNTAQPNKMQELQKRVSALLSNTTRAEPATTENEVYHNELHRVLTIEEQLIENWLDSKLPSSESRIKTLGIRSEDLENLPVWLEKHHKPTLEAIERLSHKIQTPLYAIPNDIKHFQNLATTFTQEHIDKYVAGIRHLLDERSFSQDALKSIDVHPSTNTDPYFNQYLSIVGISIEAIASLREDRSFHLNQAILLRDLGHELLGHGLNSVITKKAKIPTFLKRNAPLGRGTREAVAQFYETQILEDLRKSPAAQKIMGIDDFDHNYQETKYSELINTYHRKLKLYSIYIAANRNLGDAQAQETIRKRTELIERFALTPHHASNFLEMSLANYDPDGNFSPDMVSNLIYVGNQVEQALGLIAEKGKPYDENRNEIDRFLLTGYWTPEGYLERAKVFAEEK